MPALAPGITVEKVADEQLEMAQLNKIGFPSLRICLRLQTPELSRKAFCQLVASCPIRFNEKRR